MSRLLFVSSHDLLRLLLCLRLTGVLLTSTPVGYSGGTSSDEDRPKWTRSVVNLKWSMSACICPSQVEAWFILLVWLTVPRYKREANCGSLGLPLHSSSEYDVTQSPAHYVPLTQHQASGLPLRFSFNNRGDLGKQEGHWSIDHVNGIIRVLDEETEEWYHSQNLSLYPELPDWPMQSVSRPLSLLHWRVWYHSPCLFAHSVFIWYQPSFHSHLTYTV